MRSGDDDLTEALALLARGLAGAIEVSGLEHVPRPTFAAAAPAAPTTGATTTTTTSTPALATPPAIAPTAPAVVAAAVPDVPAMTITASAPTTAPAVTTTTANDDGAPIGAALRAAIDAVVARAAPEQDRLQILQDDVLGACTRCKLHRGRNRLVFGVGNPRADLVFVGEGPGEDEDRQGIPFVGRAGQLLTKMIGAMGRDRDRDVYICNVVKCRPPNNRQPEDDEVAACLGFLDAQLAIVRPKVIVGLGGTACHTLLRTTTPISKLRGTWKTYNGIPFMPTYHPSYLLREERDPLQARKREAWGDLKLVMQKLQAQ